MTPQRRPPRPGFTLMEVLIVLVIMGVLISIPVPTFMRSVEQSKLDVAAGHLRAIWAAERFFHLENGRYGSLAELAPGTGGDDDLIEPTLVSGATFYAYSITVAADGQSFVASAVHPDHPRCVGSLSIDESGTLSCEVTYNGETMTPSLEPTP